MKIILGIGYDSRLPTGLPALFNTVICGETGLLAELESRACIAQSRQSNAARSVVYLKALISKNDTGRFYHSSILTDPISTASTILNWRDWAYLHGWAPTSEHQIGRFKDLADVETALENISPCAGERLVKLIPCVNLISQSVTDITLHDPKLAWPTLYQQLFDALEQAGVNVCVDAPAISPSSTKGSDLYQLQTSLLQNLQGKENSPTAFLNDGSLTVYCATNQHAAAQYLCEKSHGVERHIIIASENLYQLNEVAFQISREKLGLGETSQLRAPQQLLPLLLSLAWTPPDAHRILEYLTLPIGPHRQLRRQISKQFTDLPGYHPDLWSHEIQHYIESRKIDNDELDTDQLYEHIINWLPIGIAQSSTSMSIEVATALSDQVVKYWGARLSNSDTVSETTLYSAALEAANALSEALREWRDDTISRIQLDRLLDIATDNSSVSYSEARSISELNVITSPSACRLYNETLQQLSWWSFQSEAGFYEPPLHPDEYNELPFAPNEEARALQRRQALSRSIEPILKTQASATLIMTGDTQDILCQQVLNAFGLDEPPIFDESILEGRVNDVHTNTVENLSLPASQRWWHIDCAVPVPRAVESYSSLVACALKPHQYALRYAAQLSPGSLKGLPVDARLLGNLGHRVIEAWFAEHACDFDEDTINSVDKWIESHIDELIMRYALPLSSAGQHAGRLLFIDQITHALSVLLRQLKSAQVVNVQVERDLSCQIDTSQLEGTIDILAELPDKRYVIIDVKYGSQSRYESELQEGRYLQLATYSKLVTASSEIPIADVVYMILKTGELLSCTNEVFPHAKIIMPDNTATTPETVWTQFDSTVSWRMEQLNAGQLEVTYTHEPTTEHSTPPIECLTVADIESTELKKNQSFGFRQTFKVVDPWRVLVGKVEE